MGKREMKETLGEALGVAPQEIRTTNPMWLRLLQEGVIVRLHIGRWRAKTSLNWHDLGFQPGSAEEEKALADLIEPGYKRLLPREVLKRLNAIESRGRTNLESNAFRTYWGWFVPFTAWSEWRAEDDAIRNEYLGVLRDLLTGYDAIVAEVLSEYRLAARATYDRLARLNPEVVKDTTEEAFAEDVVRAIRSLIPDPDALRASFYYETELQYVPLPSLLAEEKAEADRIRAEANAEEERLRLQQRLEREKVWAEEERLQAEVEAARSAAEWKRQLMQEMHAEVVRQAKERKEKVVDSFLRDVVVQLRSLIYEVSTNVLATMERNEGRLHARSVVQLGNLVDQLERLNFSGDREVEETVKELRYHLSFPAEDRSPQEIERVLRDVATVSRATLIGLGESPRSARELGVPDRPPAEMVQEIRRRRFEEETVPQELPGLDTVPRRSRIWGGSVSVPVAQL